MFMGKYRPLPYHLWPSFAFFNQPPYFGHRYTVKRFLAQFPKVKHVFPTAFDMENKLAFSSETRRVDA
jgi:hypothetical protein